MIKSKRLFVFGMLLSLLLSGCTYEKDEWNTAAAQKPDLPEKLSMNEEGIPELEVYDVSTKDTINMDIEKYVTGVVAGEMKNDWPLEALKAQAILARTFVLKFCDTKQSRYNDADISTDVEEAQAYAPDKINDQVIKAVQDTRGLIMSAEGEYPHAWFHAHAGGKTELPTVSLDFKEDDPSYLKAVSSPDSEKAPEDVKNWKAEFPVSEVLNACEKLGTDMDSLESINIVETGSSGRAKTLEINGNEISASTFRIAIGAGKLKSTLIERIDLSEDSVVFYGKGYGHGVGMSQWGAYTLSEEGKTADEIIGHYFKDIDIVKMW